MLPIACVGPRDLCVVSGLLGTGLWLVLENWFLTCVGSVAFHHNELKDPTVTTLSNQKDQSDTSNHTQSRSLLKRQKREQKCEL